MYASQGDIPMQTSFAARADRDLAQRLSDFAASRLAGFLLGLIGVVLGAWAAASIG
jgi:hypothetical protein